MKLQIRTLLPAVLGLCLCSCSGFRQNYSELGRALKPKDPAAFRPAMVSGELFFVLGTPARVEDVSVETGDKVVNPAITMWHAGCTEPDNAICPKLTQVKYGQSGAAFASWTAPKALQPNCEYAVRMSMDQVSFAAGSFLILDNNTITVPAPRNHELVQISTITLDLNGAQAIIPYSLSFSSAGDREVIVTGPAQK